MLQRILNRAEQSQTGHQQMFCQCEASSDHDDRLQSSESEQIPTDKNFRYKRYDSIKIYPISSQSSSDDQTFQNFDITTNLNIPSTTILRERIIKKKQKIREKRKAKKKEKKRKLIQKKTVFMDEQEQWDCPKSWQIPEQCLQINRQHKNENYNELRDSILACIEGKSKARTIFLGGSKETAKKTILFDVLHDIRLNIRHSLKFHQYFLTFEEQLNNNIQQKIQKLYQFMNNNVCIPSKKSDQFIETKIEKDNNSKQIKSKKIENVLILDDYKSFIVTLKQSSNYKKIKKLLRHNASNLLIFLDSNIDKKEVQMLSLDNYLHISIINNTRQYFAISLLAAVNNYPYKNNQWEIARPLANLFSTKMDDINKLRLSIIRKLILFLENQKIQSQSSEVKLQVNHETIQKFMGKYIDRTIKIDLKKLTIHQKAVMSACFLSMKENLQIFIPIKKIYKLYTWICQSISMRSKPFKEFFHDIIFQISIYKLIKVEKGKHCEQETKIMINIDSTLIKASLKDEGILAKFFKQV